jgi:hypothetical protein
MDAAPNIVIVAQTRPAGPLLPSAKACVAVDPINEVSAAISISPVLSPKVPEPELEPNPEPFKPDMARSPSRKPNRENKSKSMPIRPE